MLLTLGNVLERRKLTSCMESTWQVAYNIVSSVSFETRQGYYLDWTNLSFETRRILKTIPDSALQSSGVQEGLAVPTL